MARSDKVELMKEQILRRDELTAALQGISPRDRGFPFELFTLVSIELWLERWSSTSLRIAA